MFLISEIKIPSNTTNPAEIFSPVWTLSCLGLGLNTLRSSTRILQQEQCRYPQHRDKPNDNQSKQLWGIGLHGLTNSLTELFSVRALIELKARIKTTLPRELMGNTSTDTLTMLSSHTHQLLQSFVLFGGFFFLMPYIVTSKNISVVFSRTIHRLQFTLVQPHHPSSVSPWT